MGLSELITQMITYIAITSGGFSQSLGYDTRLSEENLWGHPQVQLTSYDRLYTMKFNKRPPVNNVIRVQGVQFGTKIFLANDWDIEDIGDQSKLLHEIVHWMQDENGLYYECEGDKERLAYFIQEKWLNDLHGLTLYEGAGINPLVMVLAMHCPLPETYAKNGEGGP